MKKTLTAILSIVLTGCGGSSSEADSSPQQVTNNIPSLSGQFSLETKAMSSATLSLSMQDNDNDSLTLTISEQPDWLTLTTDGTEATLKVTPDFFDIGEYQLKATVSDGKASKDYQLSFAINDDPSKWQQIALSSNELAGIWSTDNAQNKFIFSQNNLGAHILNNKLTSFDYHVSNEGAVKLLQYANEECYPFCDITNNANFSIVAADDDKLRIHFKSQTEELVFNLQKQNLAPVKTHYLTDTTNYPSATISVVDQSSYLYSFFKINTNNGYFGSTVKVTGSLSNNQITADSNLQFFNKDFYNIQTGNYELLEFAVTINTIDILFADDEFFVAEQSHSIELLTDIGNYNFEDFQGLNTEMESRVNLIIQENIIPISAPDLSSGKTYTGRLLSSSLQIEDDTVRANTVFKVNTQSEFVITSYLPHKADTIETVLNVSNNGEELNYSYEGINYTARFFQKLNGDVFLAQNNKGFYFGSLFTNVDTTSSVIYEDVTGLYIDTGLSTPNKTVYFAFTEDGRALFSDSTTESLPELNAELETDNFWTVENNRILVINKFSCPSAFSFESCVNETQAREGVGILYRSLEYLGEYNNSILYNYSSFYRLNGETKGDGTLGLRLLKKQ